MIARRFYPGVAACVLAAGMAATALSAPANEAPKETLEATATRVRELEKANVVLQEDLARMRLQLDLTREALDKARAGLEAETAARRALEAQLAQARQEATREIASSNEATRKELAGEMQARLAALEQSIQALSARQQAELTALKEQHEARIASLQQALEKETAARQELEKETSERIAGVETRQKRDRTWGFVMNGLNLGFTLSK